MAKGSIFKPRKSWEPEYRFGGDKCSVYMPLPLGRTNAYALKSKGKKKGSRRG